MEFYFRAKYVLYAVASFLTYLVTLPYAFFDSQIAVVHTVCFLLNLGISFPMLIYFSNYNNKPIDLGKGAFFNTEGSNVKQFLVVVPILLGPMLIFAPFYVFGLQQIGFAVLAGIGIMGILAAPYLIKAAAKFHNERKYKLVESYRNR
jgi:glucan phosphoethanolaminetransferase (alkaline phosphatase superfamily)